MANAAAKKAAAAKEATANVYQPILIATNLVYILLLLGLDHDWTLYYILGVALTWALQVFSYVGILDQAKNTNTTKSKDLVGGAHLDLLGLTLLLQFTTALHSPKWFYLLWGVPAWAGWMFYRNFGGGNNKKQNDQDNKEESNSNNAGASQEKREKRAQKRKNKWA